MEKDSNTPNVIIQAQTIACNMNTVYNAFDLNKKESLLAYACSNLIAILDQKQCQERNIPQVLFTLKGHTDRVNSVKWITNTLLLSVSADKRIIIWECDRVPRDMKQWRIKQIIDDAHDAPINFLTVLNVDNLKKELYFATLCINGRLSFFQNKNEQNQFEKRGQIIFGKNLQEAFNITLIGQQNLLLILGGFDKNIHCYTCKRIEFQDAKDQYIDNFLQYKLSLSGHMDSIKDLKFSSHDFQFQNQVQYLASSSQDHNIRIWKIQPLDNIKSEIENSIENQQIEQTDEINQYQSKTSYVIQLDNDQKKENFNIALESVLVQHQDSVSSLDWAPSNSIIQNTSSNSLKYIVQSINDLWLLSSSFDFTVCLWKIDSHTLQWNAVCVLGAMTGNKHAYYGAKFLDFQIQDKLNCRQIFAYTFGGAMHLWKQDISENDDIIENQWKSQLTVKGHFDEVTDLDWDPNQKSCLVSCSKDQTTRIFTEYQPDSYFEISRPQVHGYDMNCVSFLKNQKNTENHKLLPFKIISGGDEKVIRLFEAPFSFIKTYNSLNPKVKSLELEQMRFRNDLENQQVERMIGEQDLAAKKQPLGLMNKPQILLAKANMRVDEEETGGVGENFDPMSVLSNTKSTYQSMNQEIKEPPVEEILMSKTLWPESQKLYGHAHEVFCIATSHQGDMAASACKSKSEQYTSIIIWEILQQSNENQEKNFENQMVETQQSSIPVCTLSGFQYLTVVQLEFTKDDMYLGGVTRDRQILIFKRQNPSSFQFDLLKRIKEAHSRIIWALSWSFDNLLLATASRENKNSIRVWNGISDELSKISTQHSLLPANSVPCATSLQFFPCKFQDNGYGLLIGQENGEMTIWTLQNIEQNVWTLIHKFDDFISHSLSVRRIKFGNYKHHNDDGKDKIDFSLASCGDDHTVRFFNISL